MRIDDERGGIRDGIITRLANGAKDAGHNLEQVARKTVDGPCVTARGGVGKDDDPNRVPMKGGGLVLHGRTGTVLEDLNKSMQPSRRVLGPGHVDDHDPLLVQEGLAENMHHVVVGTGRDQLGLMVILEVGGQVRLALGTLDVVNIKEMASIGRTRNNVDNGTLKGTGNERRTVRDNTRARHSMLIKLPDKVGILGINSQGLSGKTSIRKRNTIGNTTLKRLSSGLNVVALALDRDNAVHPRALDTGLLLGRVGGRLGRGALESLPVGSTVVGEELNNLIEGLEGLEVNKNLKVKTASLRGLLLLESSMGEGGMAKKGLEVVY